MVIFLIFEVYEDGVTHRMNVKKAAVPKVAAADPLC